MDGKTEIKKKLVIPAALAVAVLAVGCGGPTPPGNDAAPTDGGVADASGHDAGCIPPYEQIDDTCQLVV
jgi:hypothetical protein